MIDLAEQQVAEIPLIVGGKIDGIGPASRRRVARLIGDVVVDADGVADAGAGGHYDPGGDQIGRRRDPDQQRLRCGRGVVLLGGKFADPAELASTPGTCRVGDHEDVVGAGQLLRRGDLQAGIVAAAGGQAAKMLEVAEIVVLGDIQEAVTGKVDQVVP